MVRPPARAASRALANLFLQDINSRPEDFKMGTHTIDDIQSGRRWWISNGRSWFGLYEPIDFHPLYWWDSLRCWWAFSFWLSQNTVRIVAETDKRRT